MAFDIQKASKTKLRTVFLEKRKSLSAQERSFLSQKIADKFFQSFDLKKVRFLHCFLPIEKFAEVDTRLIFERVWLDFPQIQTLAPKIDFEWNEMESVAFDKKSSFEINKWGVKEPIGQKVSASDIDMILVPLICFDKQGFRVGYGKGFYDRFLKSCRPDSVKIGLSFFEPIEKITDVSETDVKMDYCITPEKIYSFL